MKRGLSLVVMIVSLVGISCRRAHQEPTPTPTPTPTKADPNAAPDPWKQQAGKKNPLPHPLFWSAEKDGKTIYFLGTMHMGIEPEERLPQIVWDKLDAAKAFAMEADLSKPGLMNSMVRTGGSLHEDLGDEYWKKLEAAVGHDMAAQMDRTTPMGAAAMMALKDLPRTSPMDGILLGRAMNKGKPIVYLEDAQLQIDILTKHMDLRALKLMIDTAENGTKQSKAMLDAYAEGDEKKILAINDEQKDDALKHGYTQKEFDEQMEDILYKRNASWIEKLEKMAADGGGFVAVGALHLSGPRSVLDLLSKKGFTIKRIEP
ncbi:MAG TPA: TraB/GumN family protein [Kofleriaceae bacterium]|nr:TraB/GumN family protein [Kofleriaceae bacterium]